MRDTPLISQATPIRSPMPMPGVNTYSHRSPVPRPPSLYDVLVEKTETTYVARALFWPHEEIIAETREAVLTKALAVIQKHLSQSEIVTLSVDTAPKQDAHSGVATERQGLGTRISKRFAAIGGVDLDIPARSMPRPAPTFDDDTR